MGALGRRDFRPCWGGGKTPTRKICQHSVVTAPKCSDTFQKSPSQTRPIGVPTGVVSLSLHLPTWALPLLLLSPFCHSLSDNLVIPVKMGAATNAPRQIDALNKALNKMKASTSEACLCCDQLTKRARQLDSLTSPASDASSLLSKASNNLGATIVLMNEAREKLDTIRDCEPAIERLKRGVVQMQNEKNGKANKARRNPFEDGEKDSNIVLSEQDVYAAADSMEIIRDAHEFFVDRKHWRSTAAALASLERVHHMGVSSMCILASFHLIGAGQAVRLKRVVKQEGDAHVTPATETAEQVCNACLFYVIANVLLQKARQ